MKKFILLLLLISAAAIGGIFVAKDQILTRVVESQAIPLLAGQTLAELPDGLHVMLCGTGSPMPDTRRAGPCTLVIAGKNAFVVDTGAGSGGRIPLMGIPYGALQAVFLTHFHSDHIDGLGELLLQRWAGSGAQTPLPIYGPSGVSTVVAGFRDAYALDAQYRVAHHGADLIPPQGQGGVAHPFVSPTADQGQVVYTEGGLKVTAFAVGHHPVEPAVGYRFDYAGRSVAISGDTAPNANIEAFSQGVDLLLHEAQSSKLVKVMQGAAIKAGNQHIAQIYEDILDYHTEPVAAAQIAERAKVRHLALHHIVPPLPARPLEWFFLRGVDQAFSGEVTLGEDGTTFLMPAESTSIEVRSARLW